MVNKYERYLVAKVYTNIYEYIVGNVRGSSSMIGSSDVWCFWVTVFGFVKVSSRCPRGSQWSLKIGLTTDMLVNE